MKKLLSGNEALAWGAYHAGARVATAYPGTPSTEILESIARFDDIYAEWSTNEKVAMEVALGACYTGVRAVVSMKHVGLNVAADPFMAAAITGVSGGLVLICADDPGIHSSQSEQDNRHYARLAKIPVLEPSDSQEAYDMMAVAFDISEQYDTPVMLRTTTRISHSKSVVDVNRSRPAPNNDINFPRNVSKYVMLPVNARFRHPQVEERIVKLEAYAENSPLNRIETGTANIGVITSGVAYQYAREVLPEASFLKLGMTHPLSEDMVKRFAAGVERVIVIEELDPVLEENIKAMGVNVSGKDFIPLVGELSSDVTAKSMVEAGIIETAVMPPDIAALGKLPRRPPLLCPGCPHVGTFFILASMGQRLKPPGESGGPAKKSNLVITGDIGCYTLATYPPLNAMDTTACMGASIGQALGMQKAGLDTDVVAVIGDSTFMHSGITPLIDAVYNEGKITIVILDNGTTAMTGHQEHPGTGISAQGNETTRVQLENVVRGVGVSDVSVVNAYDIKELRKTIRKAVASPELSVIIARGDCVVGKQGRGNPRVVDTDKCNRCDVCLLIGCPALQTAEDRIFIDASLCVGEICTVCQQVCPQQAISPLRLEESGADNRPGEAE
ncbi:MAG TPA: indolepyruvate ferredoxin oxidoreductase subunit alpha [Dehalococcoidia bacterium]|nr:indolepyruvate ferredoxin oxidoreductase subunit alpha [Dehalococcoidia bacterium]